MSNSFRRHGTPGCPLCLLCWYEKTITAEPRQMSPPCLPLALPCNGLLIDRLCYRFAAFLLMVCGAVYGCLYFMLSSSTLSEETPGITLAPLDPSVDFGPQEVGYNLRADYLPPTSTGTCFITSQQGHVLLPFTHASSLHLTCLGNSMQIKDWDRLSLRA